MSTLYQSILQYISKDMSRNDIHQITGIPFSTMSYVINEIRDLPQIYHEEIDILYSQTAYSRLRDFGILSLDAEYYAGQHPDKVLSVEDNMTSIIDRLTTGSISQRAYDDDIEVTDEYIQSIYSDTQNSIISSLQDHPKPYDYYTENY